MEELEAELCDRGVAYPRAMGICHQLPTHDEPSMRRRLSALIEFG